MGNQIVEALEKHAARAEDFPEIQARARQHLEATWEHGEVVVQPRFGG